MDFSCHNKWRLLASWVIRYETSKCNLLKFLGHHQIDKVNQITIWTIQCYREINFTLNFKTESTFFSLIKQILYDNKIQIQICLLWWQSSAIHVSNASSTKKKKKKKKAEQKMKLVTLKLLAAPVWAQSVSGSQWLPHYLSYLTGKQSKYLLVKDVFWSFHDFLNGYCPECYKNLLD